MIVFKLEMKKALKGKLFWLVTIFAVILAVISAVLVLINADMYKTDVQEFGVNPYYALKDNVYVNTVYRDKETVTPPMFYRFIPLRCALAYGWSYSSDIRSGYIKNVITRTSKLKYLTSKYFATFIIGGLVVLIPIIVNILTLACFMAFRTPDPSLYQYYTERPAFTFANLFYSTPPLYMAIFLCLHFILGGLFATFSMAVSMFTTNKYIVTLFPFVFSFLYSYVSITFLNNVFNGEMDPLLFLTTQSLYYRIGEYVFGVLAIFFILTAGTIFFRGMKKDVF